MSTKNFGRRDVCIAAAATIGSALLSRPTLAAKPGPGGFSNEGLKRVTTSLQPFVESGESVGLVTLLYRRGDVAQVNTLGWQDREAKVPMARNSLFRMASMTKPPVAVATLILIEEGKLKLTDSVEKWLPELTNMKVLRVPGGALEDTVPASRPITVLDLLTHRSGIAYNFTTTGPLSKALSERFSSAIDPDISPDQWIKIMGTIPLAYDVGNRWQYGLSFDVLGVLIERVSGMSLPEFMRTRIFAPLGMNDTGFFVPQEKTGRVAVMYGFDKEDKRVPTRAAARTTPPKFAAGGAGLFSTADDYLKFTRMLLGLGRLGDTRIISKRSVELMTTNWLTPEQRKTPLSGDDRWAGQGFGLGVSVVDDIARHSGVASKGTFSWPGAFGTWWQADPQEDMIMIYLVQNAANLRVRTPEETAALREKQAQSSLATFQASTYRAIDV